MGEHDSTHKLLVLRKLTRAIADPLREQLRDYISTLAPQLRPTSVFGEYVQGSTKVAVKGADKAFKDLQDLYESIAGTKPFSLSKELKAPFEILSSVPEMTPMEYSYMARGDRETKTVTITSPLKWALTYSGFAPSRLRTLLANRDRDFNDLPSFLLHYLVMHLVVTKQQGITNILEALQFAVTSDRSPEFGNLPMTYVTSSVSTSRPPDEVVIESTEISGMDVFEEVVNVDDIVKMRNPLKDRLLEIVKSHGGDLSFPELQ